MKPVIKISGARTTAGEGYRRCKAHSNLTKMDKWIKAGETELFLFTDPKMQIRLYNFDNFRPVDVTIENQTSVPLIVSTVVEGGDELTNGLPHNKRVVVKGSDKPVTVFVHT